MGFFLPGDFNRSSQAGPCITTDNRVYRTSIHTWQLVPSEFKDSKSFKTGNGSQATAHAGYGKHILEMLALFKLLVWG